MRKLIILTAAIAGIAAAAPAFARDDARCTVSPGAGRLSADAVRAKLAESGYKVARIKTGHGCYEVHATDRGGAAVELRVDPVTAKVLRTEMDD
jgi:hypothetical protein